MESLVTFCKTNWMISILKNYFFHVSFPIGKNWYELLLLVIQQPSNLQYFCILELLVYNIELTLGFAILFALKFLLYLS